MHVDAFRVIRQVFTQEERERPRLGRTSLVFFVAIMAALLSIFLLTDGRSNTSYFAIHSAIIALSLAHIIWVRRFNLGALVLVFLAVFFRRHSAVRIPGGDLPGCRDAGGLVVHLAGEFGLDVRRLFLSRPRLDARQAVQPGLLIKVRMVSVRHRQIAFVAICLTIFVLALCICGFYQFNVYKILLRGYGEEAEQSALAYSLINYVARPLIFNLIFLTALIVSRRQHVPWLKIMGLCLLAALLVSPIGVPRSLAGALDIPLVMMVFMPRFNSSTRSSA